MINEPFPMTNYQLGVSDKDFEDPRCPECDSILYDNGDCPLCDRWSAFEEEEYARTE